MIIEQLCTPERHQPAFPSNAANLTPLIVCSSLCLELPQTSWGLLEADSLSLYHGLDYVQLGEFCLIGWGRKISSPIAGCFGLRAEFTYHLQPKFWLQGQNLTFNVAVCLKTLQGLWTSKVTYQLISEDASFHGVLLNKPLPVFVKLSPIKRLTCHNIHPAKVLFSFWLVGSRGCRENNQWLCMWEPVYFLGCA